MQQKECIAMILAGGRGERLGALTRHIAKPIVHFGSKYRIIDFTLSNCTYSNIDSLGILTQYNSMALHDYITNGQAPNFTGLNSNVFMLPSSRCRNIYTGTANAVYQNFDFISKFNPEHVLILSADHIYKMDYREMLEFHKKTNADITISVTSVPWEEASRFGIMSINKDKKIIEFEEKPKQPKSNLASMGIYIFKWSSLKRYLSFDQNNSKSEHDFGKNIIPAVISAKQNVYAYEFEGYWRDVGTIQNLWETNMDLLKDIPPINLNNNHWKILTQTQHHAPCYISAMAEVKRSLIADGCNVYGKISNSILFHSVTVEKDAEIIDSILLPGVVIGKGAKIYKSIIGENAFVGTNAEIGTEKGISAFLDSRICTKDISLIGPGICIANDMKIMRNSHIRKEVFLRDYLHMPPIPQIPDSEMIYA
ncbi:glucose-1-phosphate adenylyltransferase [Selenomonadales bacterium OttesenSCG-928-I06]|nr:glucose-1-phosphate adenylyltransferase [Selenomonadales bacterium OttesenSCG-928-I06]